MISHPFCFISLSKKVMATKYNFFKSGAFVCIDNLLNGGFPQDVIHINSVHRQAIQDQVSNVYRIQIVSGGRIVVPFTNVSDFNIYGVGSSPDPTEFDAFLASFVNPITIGGIPEILPVAIDGITPGQSPMGASVPVTMAIDQTEIPVKLISADIVGQKPMAESIPVAIAADQGAIPVNSQSEQLPPVLGQNTTAFSLGITFAADQNETPLYTVSNFVVTKALYTGSAPLLTYWATGDVIANIVTYNMANSTFISSVWLNITTSETLPDGGIAASRTFVGAA